MSGNDTIVALASGSLPSAIAILRISGPKCREILHKFLQNPLKDRQIARRDVCDPENGAIIDNGMVVLFPGPNSFTGEDCLEFQVHGSVAVTKKILLELSKLSSVRLAEPGEFSRRAFENGKMDLIEIEGLGDLVTAETESQRVQAVGRMGGNVRQHLQGWRSELTAALVRVEAQLDFGDENDVASFDAVEMKRRMDGLVVAFLQAISTYEHGRIIREGYRIGLGGPPNVGKSSVLNRLARSDIAIVSPEAGTTRDIHEVPIEIGGQLALVLDSAGLREASSLAEKEGVKRAKNMLADCDLVLWISSFDVPETSPCPVSGSHVINLGNKSDVGLSSNVDLELSCKTGAGFEELTELLRQRMQMEQPRGGAVVLSRLRDRQAMQSARQNLERVSKILGLFIETKQEQPIALELVAEEIRASVYALQRLLGEVDAENVLDALFSGFCIGK